MNIKDILIKEEKTTWIKYIDDFEVKIRFVPRGEMTRMFERSKSITWDKRDHTKVEKVDSDIFYKNFVDKVIMDWKGLKASTLKKMLPIQVTDENQEIPFTPENAYELIRGAYDFDLFINNAVVDLENFDREKSEAEKKI